MSDNIIIKSTNLNYKIDEKYILKNIDIEIEKGSFVGILGPNGSGKSTFLKHLYGSIVPKENTVYIKGVDIYHYKQKELSKNISVLNQENSTEFSYSVMDITLLGRAPYIESYENYKEKDYELALRNLDFVGMRDFTDRTYSSLSGGEKQRVLLARSLTQESDILLLDEPTNHLDILYKYYIMKLVKNLNKTIIAVIHELDLAYRFCDYIFLLDKGKLVKHGIPSVCLSPAMLEKVFRINAEIIKYRDGKDGIIVNDVII